MKYLKKLIKTFLIGKYIRIDDIDDKLEQNLIGNLEIEINTHSHGIDLQHNINVIKKIIGLDYEKTAKILRLVFSKMGKKKNYNLLNLNTKEFNAFIISNIDRLKEVFLEIEKLPQFQQELKFIKEGKYNISAEMYYPFVSQENDNEVLETNVYMDYNNSMITRYTRSTSEQLFELYCDKNENVDFVYKNGDKGQQYLSIVYSVAGGKKQLFYPDYVVKLKDGSIWIIETKGGEVKGVDKNIDNHIYNKFEAFKNYAKRFNYNFAL